MFPRAIVVALAALAAVINAAPQRGDGWRPGNLASNTRCYTAMGGTAVRGAVKTAYTTTFQPCTSTSTTTVQTVSTQPPTTSTVTETSVTTSTAPTSFLTSTVSTTLTFTVTTDTTLTDTATTIVTTSSTSTYTVPAPTGFVPIQSSLPGTSYNGKGGNSPVVRRGVKNPVSPNPGAVKYIDLFKSDKKPQSVRCVVSQTATKCATTISTVTSTSVQSASTNTITTTSISTSIAVPSATTTVTSTVSTTIFETNTVTTTTTSTTTTTAVSTTSVYAACATNNFGTDVNGQHMNGAAVDNLSYTVTDVTVTTAYDCCVAAMSLANTQIWRFYTPGTINQCSIAYFTTCQNPAYQWKSEVDAVFNGNYVWGNAGCGRFTSSY